ncbi:MAG: hypothetical protein JJU46_06925 [Balneolaceae bacterium]|nr:hypothetical protein [Balneolaceae bacterium]MCH8548276.1 hypothetical protein [Balneolaceae bacterium]
MNYAHKSNVIIFLIFVLHIIFFREDALRELIPIAGLFLFIALIISLYGFWKKREVNGVDQTH